VSWSACLVGDLVDAGEADVKTGPFGTQLRASDYVESGTPVINVRNIGFGNIRNEKLEYISAETVERLSTHLLRPKDIVFGRKGAVERHAYISDSHDNWFQGSDCLRLRLLSEDRVVSRYMSYAFLTEGHKAWMIQQCSHGATMASLNQNIVKRIPLRLPPLPTQRRIAAILSAYDDLIENNARRIAILEEMARRLYEVWFVRYRFPGHEGIELDENLPVGWHRVPIKETYAGFYDGPHATPPPSDEGPVFLGIGNITETGRLDLSRVRHISEEDFPRWTRRVTPQAGDIVFTYEATLNRYALIPEGFRGCLGRRLALIRPDPARNYNRFLYLLFFTADWRKVISSNILAGATVDRIPLSKFPEFPINLPPKHLVVQFDEVVRPMFDQTLALERKNTNLRAQRDFLLPKLISGEIDVSEVGEPMVEAAAE